MIVAELTTVSGLVVTSCDCGIIGDWILFGLLFADVVTVIVEVTVFCFAFVSVTMPVHVTTGEDLPGC